jgi:hypothetical protein
MIEKLIENWLINVHELGYTIPFCEVLISRGYTIVRISRQGRGELGKDVIARSPAGELHTFQLKGPRDITLREWQTIQNEVRDLVQLPAIDPAINREEPHVPFLVTNGEIVGDALASIEEYSNLWERQGHAHLQIWRKHDLLGMFREAHGSYLPTDLVEFREFVQLYVSQFEDRLPREKFALFLQKLVRPEAVMGRGRNSKRAIESMVLMAGYILEQYERSDNHISAVEGWTVVATAILHVAARERLRGRDYKKSLDLIWSALYRNLEKLQDEISKRTHFIEPRFLTAERDDIRGARTTLTLGWLSAKHFLDNRSEARPVDKSILETIKRELKWLRFLGESDWPYVMVLSLFVERFLGSPVGEALIQKWVRGMILGNGRRGVIGVPSTYWLQEKVLSLLHGKLPPYELEMFSGQSYTIHSAMDMLVRRLLRQAITNFWPSASRLSFCDYLPADDAEWFSWRGYEGYMRVDNPSQPVSWREWRRSTLNVPRASVPAVLIEDSRWLLPFALTYPHRVTREMSGVIDAIIGERADLI